MWTWATRRTPSSEHPDRQQSPAGRRAVPGRTCCGHRDCPPTGIFPSPTRHINSRIAPRAQANAAQAICAGVIWACWGRTCSWRCPFLARKANSGQHWWQIKLRAGSKLLRLTCQLLLIYLSQRPVAVFVKPSSRLAQKSDQCTDVREQSVCDVCGCSPRCCTPSRDCVSLSPI